MEELDIIAALILVWITMLGIAWNHRSLASWYDRTQARIRFTLFVTVFVGVVGWAVFHTATRFL